MARGLRVREVVVREELGKAADGRERGLELVGGVADEFGLAGAELLEDGDVVEDGEDGGAVARDERGEIDGERVRLAVDGEREVELFRRAACEDVLRGLGEHGAAEDVDAVAAHVAFVEAEELLDAAVRVRDVAVRVEEDDAVVHRFEDEVQLFVLGAGLDDPLREAGGELVEGADEDVELVAGVELDAPREVAAHDGAGGADDGEDGLQLPPREVDGEEDRGEEREEERGGEHGDGLLHGGVDGRERRGRADDADEAAVFAPGDGDVEHVGADGRAVARGCAEALRERLLDLGALPMVFHGLRIAVGVGEHAALVVEHGDAQSGLRADLGDGLVEVALPRVVLERERDDPRVRDEVRLRVLERRALEVRRQHEAEDEERRQRQEQKRAEDAAGDGRAEHGGISFPSSKSAGSMAVDELLEAPEHLRLDG